VNRVTEGGDDRQGVFASQLDWALFYISLGLAVFPVAASKKPIGSLVPHGVKDASREPCVIRSWWTKRPHADLALALTVDMAVADCDMSCGQHGVADLERLCGAKIADIGAPVASTPSGGLHVWFATRSSAGLGRRYANRRLPGTAIDIKCAGGYVVAPGSANGRHWVKPPTTPLPPAPAWMDPALKREPLVVVPRVALVSAAGRPEGAPPDLWARRKALTALEHACALIAAAAPGTRDNTRHAQCYFIGGLIERGDLGYGEAYDAVLSAMLVHPPRHDLEHRIARSIESGMEHPLPISEAELWLRGLRARLAARIAAP
jgi:hypothetical protein